MIDRRFLLTAAAVFAGSVAGKVSAANMAVTLIPRFEVLRFIDGGSVEMIHGRDTRVMKRGDVFLDYTLLDIRSGDFVVLEDVRNRDGHLLIVDPDGVRQDLAKTIDEYRPTDGDEPDYAAIMTAGHVAMAETMFTAASEGPKTKFSAGGQSDGFDPVSLDGDIKTAEPVLRGLVGGYLPVLRFVYPQSAQVWSELLAFTPYGGGAVRYRLSRVETGKVTRIDYPGSDARIFYTDLEQLKAGWDTRLQPAMSLEVPDQRLTNLARHSLIYNLLTDDGVAMPAWGLGSGILPVPAAAGELLLQIRNLLVREDTDGLWLAKDMPRRWLENDQLAFINEAPTPWGRISFAFDSDRAKRNRIQARIELPDVGIPVATHLRFRAADTAMIRSVRVNDRQWPQFDGETVVLPAGMGGKVLISARY